jgi:class 3 adenylate cyclase
MGAMEHVWVAWADPTRALAIEGFWERPVTVEIQVDPAAWPHLSPQLSLDMGAGSVRIDGQVVLERNQMWLFNERQRIDVPLEAAQDGVIEVQIFPALTTHWTFVPVGWVDKIHLGESHELDAIEAASLRSESSEGQVWTNVASLLMGLVVLWLWRRRPESILLWFAIPLLLHASISVWIALESGGLVPAFVGWGPIKSMGATIGATGIVAFYARIAAPNRPTLVWGAPLVVFLSMAMGIVQPHLGGRGFVQASVVSVLLWVAIRNRVREAAWIAIPLGFFVLERLHRMLESLGVMPVEWMGDWQISPLGVLLVPFSMVMILAQRLAFNLEAVERFVPREYLAAIGASDLAAVEPGQRVTRTMTVLFTDIRGFTTLSERLGPTRLADATDRVLGVQADAIAQAGGFVDKYIGDAVMALFADPVDAVRAAKLCVARVEELKLDISIGVGVHLGELRLGTVGTPSRLACTVMGDTVNLAARIEGLTRVFGNEVLLTESAAKAAGVAYRRVDRVVVKGRNESVVIVEPEVAPEGWEKAFEAWTEGRFAEAAHGFEGLQDVLADRCRRLAEDPPQDWDGVTRMSQK